MQSAALQTMMYGRPCRAPVQAPRRILEIGCGTGSMTRYLAERHSSATTVIGVDLSPVPRLSTDPDRLYFIEGDFHGLALSHPEISGGGFEYIFSRLLYYSITDWPAYIAQAIALLAPGGWLELQEIHQVFYNADGSEISGSWHWLQHQTQEWRKRGLNMQAGRALPVYLRDAGLIDISTEEFRWVFGRWREHVETDAIGNYSPKMIPPLNFAAYAKILGPSLSEEELAMVKDEMDVTMAGTDDGKHFPFVVTCGRKALDSDVI